MEQKEQFVKTLKNWWWYNWRYCLLALTILLCLWYIFGISNSAPDPDYQIGLVSTRSYSQESIEAFEQCFAAFGEDCNADGQVLVRIQVFPVKLGDTSNEEALTNYRNIASLDADLVGKVSGLFLMDDPEAFQNSTYALAYLDGTAPGNDADDYENMAIPCAEIPTLQDAGMDGLHLGLRLNTQNFEQYFTLLNQLLGSVS